MDLKNLFVFLSAAINIFLGFFVYFKGHKRMINLAYGLIALSVFFWSISMALYRFSSTVPSSVFWCKILYTAPVFIVGSFLFFTYIFPEKEKTKKLKTILLFIILACSLLFGIIVSTDLIIEDVIFRLNQEKAIVFGSLYYFYIFLIPGIFIWSYINLFLKRRKSRGIARSQISYVFIGTFLASLSGMVTNLLLPTFDIFYLNWAGQILSLLMVIFIAYAIIRHRLMDIKLVMRQSSVYLFSIFTVIAVVLSIRFIFLGHVFREYFLIDFLTLILAISLFPVTKKYYYHFANRYLFSSLYDSQKVIANLSEELSSTLHDKKLYELICDTFLKSFHVQAIGILIYNKKKKKYKVEFNRHFKIGAQRYFEGDEDLRKKFVDQNKIIVVEEIRNEDQTKNRKIINLFKKLKVELLAPLNVEGKSLGFIVFGPKESRDAYNTEDLAVIDVIRSQAAVAIQNALSYKEIKDFSKKLEREVKAATKELRTVNKKLRKLDKAKSEFISIASHQLRTPLTSIKGFASLLLEGAYGKVTEEHQKIMKKIYVSNERLIMLVEDLLNVSRMERGKLEYTFQPVNLRDLLESLVGSMSIQAQNKKLSLKFKDQTSKADLLIVYADSKKITEVVGNLIDNAIKYTSKGGITVTLKQINHSRAQVIVTDTGIGIKKEDIARLFEKFTRGEGVNKVNTGGTGLGLFIAKKLIEAHKGKIWVESPGLGKGSSFFVELPLTKKYELTKNGQKESSLQLKSQEISFFGKETKKSQTKKAKDKKGKTAQVAQETPAVETEPQIAETKTEQAKSQTKTKNKGKIKTKSKTQARAKK